MRKRNCLCTPGSEENGWHEQRCTECVAHERAIWAKVVARSNEAMKILSRSRKNE